MAMAAATGMRLLKKRGPSQNQGQSQRYGHNQNERRGRSASQSDGQGGGQGNAEADALVKIIQLREGVVRGQHDYRLRLPKGGDLSDCLEVALTTHYLNGPGSSVDEGTQRGGGRRDGEAKSFHSPEIVDNDKICSIGTFEHLNI